MSGLAVITTVIGARFTGTLDYTGRLVHCHGCGHDMAILAGTAPSGPVARYWCGECPPEGLSGPVSFPPGVGFPS